MINEFAGQDCFDSRNVQERIGELEDLTSGYDDKSEYSEDYEELKELIKFKDAVGSSEWESGITFIEDNHFEDYAQEFAEDIGAINRDKNWPANCIDWKHAARELQMDYTSAEFDGHTFYYHI